MTNSQWDHEAILSRFRDWLTQTAEEIESLASQQTNQLASLQHPPPAENGDSADESASISGYVLPGQSVPEVGLLQVVEALTALRHELKLQTKGVRNLETSVERSLQGLDAASQIFQSAQTKQADSPDRTSRPFVEALIELDEGLLRAVRAFQAVSRPRIDSTRAEPPAEPLSEGSLQDDLDRRFDQQPWWRRLIARRWHSLVLETISQKTQLAIFSQREGLNNLLQGLELVQARLDRALKKNDIQRLDQVGGPVDPTLMTVVEVVERSDLPPETVAEIVRPGYTWGERVIRFAEVRAVPSQPSQTKR